jgi:hypothetical protein
MVVGNAWRKTSSTAKLSELLGTNGYEFSVSVEGPVAIPLVEG